MTKHDLQVLVSRSVALSDARGAKISFLSKPTTGVVFDSLNNQSCRYEGWNLLISLKPSLMLMLLSPFPSV